MFSGKAIRQSYDVRTPGACPTRVAATSVSTEKPGEERNGQRETGKEKPRESFRRSFYPLGVLNPGRALRLNQDTARDRNPNRVILLSPWGRTTGALPRTSLAGSLPDLAARQLVQIPFPLRGPVPLLRFPASATKPKDRTLRVSRSSRNRFLISRPFLLFREHMPGVCNVL